MRIAVFTSQFPARVSTFFARDMRALLAAGAEIDVFPFYPPDPALWQYVPAILNQRVLPRSRVHHIGLARSVAALRPWPLRRAVGFAADGLAIARSAAHFGAGPLMKSLYVLPKAWAWARAMEHEAYDHVFAYWGNYAASCAFVAHRALARDIPFSFFLHAGTDLYRDRVFMREKLLHAAYVVTECEFNRALIRDAYPDIWPVIADRVAVNYMGIDLDELRYAPDGRPPGRIVAVGRQDRGRGYDLLIHAFAQLWRRGAAVQLEFVGDGEQGPALRALATSLGVADAVRFRGWLTFDEVRRAMSTSTVFVHPPSELGDAKPNVIEEAMALGTPVVATTIAGIPELLDGGRCGVLVPPGDVGALTQALEALLADAARRTALAGAARRHAERTLDLWRNGRRLLDALRAASAPPGARYGVRRRTTKTSNSGPVVGGGDAEPPTTGAGAAALTRS